MTSSMTQRRPSLGLVNPCRLVALALLAGCGLVHAEPLRIATWNLGWHVASAELAPWISACAKTYVRDAASGTWLLTSPGAPGGSQGWDITEYRARIVGVDLSVMPPCGVYQTADHRNIPVSPEAYEKRDAQRARVLESSVNADVIAFQEVSGTAAVREALGARSNDYNVCSFDGKYKVQRLAFAWRKKLGDAIEPCSVVHDVSLPSLPPENQVRPALTVALKLNGRRVRFMTVHLKSGCVSPLDSKKRLLDGNTGDDDPCPTLQQQVAPLESAYETLGVGVDAFIMLGDFNRNLAHENARVEGAEPVRSDGVTDLATARPGGVRTRNLWLEINDGAPASSRGALLAATCPVSMAAAAACDAAKHRALSSDEQRALTARTALGCRNAIGLDHVVVSQNLVVSVKQVVKVPIGAFGSSLPASPPKYPNPLLAVSDHCPVVLDVDL